MFYDKKASEYDQEIPQDKPTEVNACTFNAQDSHWCAHDFNTFSCGKRFIRFLNYDNVIAPLPVIEPGSNFRSPNEIENVYFLRKGRF